MGSFYALIVGINEYQYPVNRLSGCVNDARHVQSHLRARVAGEIHEAVLLDRDATRAAIVDAFRSHLCQAGKDDVALFWYSGHGSEQLVPDGYWFLEPTGFCQTLVCADSRRNGVPDLVDKELSVLIEEVAGRGAHTVVVLDCCHSGGGTREPFVSYRGVEANEEAPKLSELIPELRERAGAARDSGPAGLDAEAPYVALAACRPFEKAKELRIDGEIRGVFSAALLAALQTLGRGATYRDLLTSARCRVENAANEQFPELWPAELGGIADQPFLGGTAMRPVAPFVLRHVHGDWNVNAGRCHGIPQPSGGETVSFAVARRDGDSGGQQARVTAVFPERSTAVPDGWVPDPALQYPVVVTDVPLPPAAVVLGGLDDDNQEALDRVGRALMVSGPDAGPSPHVRIVKPDDPAPGFRLRVSTMLPSTVVGPGLRILRSDGSPATPDVMGHGEDSARLVASRMDHIAQWSHFKNLDNPGSAIAGAVTIEVVEAQAGETLAPKERPALVPDQHGELHVAYRRVPAGWEAPSIFVRLRNSSDRRLWCVLLDLTDRYRVHPDLFPGMFVGPHEVAVAREGKPIRASLPPGRPVAPGAVGRDWFKMIFSDEEFESAAYHLPRLDEPPARGVAAPPPRGVLDRLGLRATWRDLGDDLGEVHPGDWATAIVPLLTSVPAEPGQAAKAPVELAGSMAFFGRRPWTT